MHQETIERLKGGTHAFIDLDAYARNIEALKASLPSGTAFMAVVKADAYGHGALFCAKHAVNIGVDWLGVARISEGIRLREGGVRAPILVLGPPNINELELARSHDLTISIGSESVLEAATKAVALDRTPLKAHLKIDTGMMRYGFLPTQAVAAIKRTLATPGVVVDGVFTHFACADAADQATTEAQLELFLDTVRLLRTDWEPNWVHAANSAGTLSGRVVGTNLVRCGIATYGLSPSAEVPVDQRFSPILSLRTVIGRALRIEPGAGVSYGHTYRVAEAERVATVPIGYADGLPRQISNRGWLAWRGRCCPIRGHVCMDQTIVEVPEDAHEGDEIAVVGSDRAAMTVDDVARLSGTINYEAVTRIMARVPRIYVEHGQPVAWEHPSLGRQGEA
jgi:alanine racemase